MREILPQPSSQCHSRCIGNKSFKVSSFSHARFWNYKTVMHSFFLQRETELGAVVKYAYKSSSSHYAGVIRCQESLNGGLKNRHLPRKEEWRGRGRPRWQRCGDQGDSTWRCEGHGQLGTIGSTEGSHRRQGAVS